MAKTVEKQIVMKAVSSTGIRIFDIIVRIFACLALHLFIVSSLKASGAAEYLSGLIGVAFAAAYMFLSKKKLVRIGIIVAAAVYIIACVTIFFSQFASGAVTVWNKIAFAANANLHYGFPSFETESSPLGIFLFLSVLSSVLSLVVAAVSGKSRTAYIVGASALTVAGLCFGLFPQPYAIVLLAASFVGVLTVDRGLTLKAAACYVCCSIVFFAAVLPCFFYTESAAVADFKESIGIAAETVMYGKDSLPEGRLKNAAGMRGLDDERLKIDLAAQVSRLYLKGFVGSDFDGSVWKPTDKNEYVSGGYQGLLEYLSVVEMPVKQYARYSALSGSVNRYEVTVENVGANRKYVYAPYTVSSYSSGAQYYDLGLRSGVFSSKSCTFEVFAGDKSSERVQQAPWVTESGDRTAQMTQYLGYEGEYRSFVSKTYVGLDAESKALIARAFEGIQTDSINTLAQSIRAYFSDNFGYSDVAPDKIESDFAEEFFGGKITRANAAYFATAATLVFRSYGKAARYVEGYLVTAEESAVRRDVSVTGNNAHAWTEVYFDGIGWLPIEVTPTFYSDEDPDNPIDPDDPNKPDPPDTPDTPPGTETPPGDMDPPELPKITDVRLLTAVKALLGVSSVLLIVVIAMLALLVRRQLVVAKKQHSLQCNGEAFGRAAFRIMTHDCKPFGGFNESTLEKFGIERDRTARFNELVERCVYGGYDLSVNEKLFVIGFINKTSDAIPRDDKLEELICKYIFCIGL